MSYYSETCHCGIWERKKSFPARPSRQASLVREAASAVDLRIKGLHREIRKRSM
jgi:hypothetical protein